MVPIEIAINYHHTLINCCSHCFFVSFSLVDFISFSFDHLSSYLLVFSVLFGAFFPSLSQSMLFVFSVVLFLYHSIHEPSSQQLTSNFFSLSFYLCFSSHIFYFLSFFLFLLHSIVFFMQKLCIVFSLIFDTMLSRIRNVYMYTLKFVSISNGKSL